MVSNASRESSVHHPHATAIHGDQGIHICDACCKGYRCNAADCFNLRKSESVFVSFSLLTYLFLSRFLLLYDIYNSVPRIQK